MNFIKHFRDWLYRVAADDRLDAIHVSLYLALFHEWNRHRFRTPFTIFREEIMTLAKVRSPNTYTRCLRELHDWGYLVYEPSFNPRQGSRVHMFRFEKGSETGDDYPTHNSPDNGSNNSRNKGSDNGSDNDPNTATDNGTDKGLVKVVIPYNINILNSTNSINDINLYGTSNENSTFGDGRKTDASHPPGDSSTNSGNQKKRTGGAGARGRGTGAQRLGAIPGSLAEAQAYFLEIQSTAAEAEKFFNHFESNGWKVGGRSKMKNWRAAARNWVLNAPKFAYEQPTKQPKPGPLLTGPKNYSEPL